MIRPAQPQPPAVLPEEMRVALRRCRGALLGACLFSAVVNVLAPTGTLYMLQLYDRVLPSHSVQTLVGLTVLMLLHYAGFGQDRAVAARAGVRRDYPARRHDVPARARSFLIEALRFDQGT